MQTRKFDMRVQNRKKKQVSTGDGIIVLLRLYVADKSPNSARAMANLKSICLEYLKGRYQIEVIDILKEPLRALSEGVLVTPTLVRLSPLPMRKILGDLSNRLTVIQALELGGGAE
jgi:circadian clock protein KaiB